MCWCVYMYNSEKSEMASQFNIVNVNERDDSEDDAYWMNYHNIISSEKDEVWDALIYTFNKYQWVRPVLLRMWSTSKCEQPGGLYGSPTKNKLPPPS